MSELSRFNSVKEVPQKISRELRQKLFEETSQSSNKLREILNIAHFPENPQQLPKEFTLTPNELGDFEEMILATAQDRKERAQLQQLRRNGQLRSSSLHVEEELRVAVPFKIHSLRKLFLGEENFLHAHTHHVRANYQYSFLASSGDIALVLRQDPLIFLIGAQDGVSAIVKTSEALRRKPTRGYEKFYRLMKEKLLAKNFAKMDPKEQATELNVLGLGYYIWLPSQGAIHQGDFQSSITLRKIEGVVRN